MEYQSKLFRKITISITSIVLISCNTLNLPCQFTIEKEIASFGGEYNEIYYLINAERSTKCNCQQIDSLMRGYLIFSNPDFNRGDIYLYTNIENHHIGEIISPGWDEKGCFALIRYDLGFQIDSCAFYGNE